MVQRHAYAAPTQKRVFFLNGKIGQRFVATDVQRAHGHRPRLESLHMLAVQGPLLHLCRESILAHEGHFGAEQAYTFGAPIQRPRNVTSKTNVHPELHLPSIPGNTGQLFQVIELLSEDLLLLQQ